MSEAVAGTPAAAKARRAPSLIGAVFRFELTQQLRSPLFPITAAIFFLLAFLAAASENVTVGDGTDNLNLNAPWAIVQTHIVFSIVAMFIAVAFCATAVTRDHEARMAEIVMSTTLGPRAYFAGRFLGSMLPAILAASASIAGTLAGNLMPWLDADRIGAFDAMPYLYSFAVVMAPTIAIECALFFSLAALTRTQTAAYAGTIALIGFYVVVGQNTDAETIATTALLDPFGSIPFDYATRYWTVFDRNARVPAIDGTLAANRAIWLGLAMVVLFVAWRRFRFAIEPGRLWHRRGDERMGAADTEVVADRTMLQTPTVPHAHADRVSGRAVVAMFRSQLRLDLAAIFRSPVFFVVLLFGFVNALFGMLAALAQGYGTPVLPATQMLLGVIEGVFVLALVIVVAFFAGELVHRERAARVADIVDATPMPSGVLIASKIVALELTVVAMLVVATLTAIGLQVGNGFTELRLPAWLLGVFGGVGGSIYLAVPLAVFIQVALDRKYVGMLVFVAVFISLPVLRNAGFEHGLYQFGLPEIPYTDMNGFGHFLPRFGVLALYWGAFVVALSYLAHLFYRRGSEAGIAERLSEARRRLRAPVVVGLACCGVVLATSGAWYFYNTNVLNTYRTEASLEALQADYEKAYKGFIRASDPDVAALDITVDIFPEERRVAIAATGTLLNNGSDALAELRFSMPRQGDAGALTIDRATEVLRDDRLRFRRYSVTPPLAPGERIDFHYDGAWRNPGFVNAHGTTSVLGNGTFFDSNDVLPLPGYDRSRELTDNNVRREHDLPPAERIAKRGDAWYRQRTVFGVAGRSAFRTTIGTGDDQIAVAPGYLQHEWSKDGRRYFVYEMDAPIWPFASFSSARYEVVRDAWNEGASNEVAIEVFHDAAHGYNVGSMIEGTKRSLDYFTSEFSPYQYRQFRILEFPGYRTFAQSFPNTIPYSERIGFLADLTDTKAIDIVFYVTAHEMAHQWWGHQVAPPYTQGATMIVESLAQYSALMVMEQRFGRERMRRFLKYELDRYLAGRGGEQIEELPLAFVENQQYIHYQKGSLALYALKDAIGEAAVNRALRRFLARFAFQGPPYPETSDLIAGFRAEALPEHQALITDLFEKIVIYDLRVTDVSAAPAGDGRTRVRIVAEAHKYEADGGGHEREVPLDQMLDVGVFEEADDLGDDDLPPVLSMAKQRVRSGENVFEVVVDGEPGSAGIDPLAVMVDRAPADNVRSL